MNAAPNEIAHRSNDYDKAFQVNMNGKTHTFESFECAIHSLASHCENCGIRIVGHGLDLFAVDILTLLSYRDVQTRG